MFSLFLLLSLFFTAYSAQGNLRTENLISSNDEWKQFSNFQEKFAKKYENLEELESRFQVFRSNLRNKFNKIFRQRNVLSIVKFFFRQ